MTFAEEYAAFLARGGKIEVIPGFTEIKSFPSREKPKRKERANTKRPTAAQQSQKIALTFGTD